MGVEFVAIAIMLLLIFFAGKQSYTVTFDLNGGTLLSGDPVQRVTQGHSATPPSVTKEGHYFRSWSGSYSKVTHDVVVYAIWEYETSPGIEYNIGENSNYCTISGAFKGLQGEIYVGAYNGNYKVLGIEDGAFENCDGITGLHFLDGTLTIGNNVFAGCTSLESIELPNTVFSMGNGIFQDCESLTSIELPRDLRNLGEDSFAGCTSLEEVVLPEGLKSIGANAFAGCESLKSIVIPSTVQEIEAGAFDGCTSLEEVIFTQNEVMQDSVDGINSEEEENSVDSEETSDEALEIPEYEGLVSIGDGAFAHCESLTQIILPEGVRSIGERAFARCESLTEIALPESVTHIGNNAFTGCIALEKVSFFATVEEMGGGVFDSAETLITLYSRDVTQVTVPETWAEDWNFADAAVEWKYLDESVQEEEETSEDSLEDSEEDSDDKR